LASRSRSAAKFSKEVSGLRRGMRAIESLL
jgi:hypothetical protein